MKLYEWQEQCLEHWISNGYRGIVNVVTGAGKTQFALAAIDHLLNKEPELRIKIIVPTIPLALQWNQALLSHTDTQELHPGFFGGGKRDDPWNRVMIYIINTARSSLSAHINREFALRHPVLLICDECHHYQSKENRRIFDFLKSYPADSHLYSSIGLSATPFGTADDAFLKKALGRQIFSFGFQEAAAAGIVSSYYICSVSVSFLSGELTEYARLSEEVAAALNRVLSCYPHLKNMDKNAFMKAVSAIARKADMDPSEPASAFLLASWLRREISVLASSRLLCCMKLLESLPENKKILIFCERISQAQTLNSMISRRYGSVSGLYHSEMNPEARSRVLKMFRNDQLRILVACRCLDEGIDVPDACVGIIVSSSSVSRQRIQRLGRILRRSAGKNAACLYYLYIRESADDSVYLPDLGESTFFSLRFFTAENCFANDLYEYAASMILDELSLKGCQSNVLQEARKCILEGLPRADYLLKEDLQTRYARDSQTLHQKNYWLMMKNIGELLSPHPIQAPLALKLYQTPSTIQEPVAMAPLDFR